MHNTHDSTDFRTPYIRTLDEFIDERNRAWYRTKMYTSDPTTSMNWTAIEHILAGLDVLYHEWSPDTPEKPASTFGRVARVEFINKTDEESRTRRQGAVLFDNHKRALLQTSDALLGYGGNGPGLSMQILTTLGVPEHLFNEANGAVTHGDYDNVVFSRESVGVYIGSTATYGGNTHSDEHRTGEMFAHAGLPVTDTWTWWLA